jgi:CRISPR system Cascade subunit CasA
MRGPERFDLRLQPWLLARGPDGTTVERSLLDTLRTAHELHGLAGEVPTQVFALTRLLLAVIHRALGGTFDLGLWAKMWQERSLPVAQAEEYLARHHDRFDLFHPETPFFQVARLRTG